MNTTIGFGVPEAVGVELADAVGLAERIDCDFLEIVMDGSGHPDRLPEDFGAALADADLELVCHLPFAVEVAAPFDAQREGLLETHRNCLDAAADLGASKAVLHPSTAAWTFAWSDEAVESAVAASVRELDADAADRGVELAVENLPSGHFTVGNFDRLLDATDASMTLDTGHARATGFESDEVLDFAAAHRDRISHVHLNDTLGESDDHLPFGAGTFDFAGLFEALGDDWEGSLCVETVVGELDYVEESVRRLRELLDA